MRAVVDAARRDKIRRNHTATHLLQAALKGVLGDHVVQQGSWVGEDRLRFDFTHPKGLTPEEIDAVERIVNAEVARNAALGTTIEDLDAAKARGVTALFGEKYDERVRVVDVPGFSTELCGGTHVRATGDIGAFTITSEAAIQAGVRRIEAVTAEAAVAWNQGQRELLRQVGQLLKSAPAEVPARVEQLLKQAKEAKKAKAKSSQADVAGALERVRGDLEERDGLLMGFSCHDLDQGGLRELASRVKTLAPDLAVVLLGRDGERVPWIALSQGKALEKVQAKDLVPFLRDHLGGGGGGKPDLAQGQGQDAAGIDKAREAVRAALAG